MEKSRFGVWCELLEREFRSRRSDRRSAEYLAGDFHALAEREDIFAEFGEEACIHCGEIRSRSRLFNLFHTMVY